MKKITPGQIKNLFTELAEVDEQDLHYLIDHSRQYILREDDFLFRKEDPSDEMHLLLSGRLRIYTLQKNQTRELFILAAGDITGLLPYSRLKTAKAHGLALEDCELLSFHRDKIPELIKNCYSLTEALVHTMSTRIREFTTLQQQNEKMMALGKLSAGLAHELNNPASAIVRSSKELKSHLLQQPTHFREVMSVKVTPEEVDEVANILFERLGRKERKKLPMMERQNLEDELAECLEDLKADDPYEIAENLVEFDFSCQELERIHSITGNEHFPPVIRWINENLTTEKMVRDIEEASDRIAKLVTSVKNFTHMDRTPDKVEADIHEGIDNTLVMLNHKIRKGNIEVKKIFTENLPKPRILVSELNQVWTNLIDNAIDALEKSESPTIEIVTKKDNDFIQILVRDNGPGIPDDIKNNIFDPFFTTKEIGKGTGLGLDVVSNIIKRHNGSIKVNSRPGNTEFEICLPII